MTPDGQCFTVGPRGYFSYRPDFSSRQAATLLGVINGFFEKSTVYDAHGQRWRSTGIECPYRRTWWTILSANTVYNPRISITVLWGEPVKYELQELKRAYSNAVAQDDDILTQFVEAEELQRRISAAQSFHELVDVYQWMETDRSHEETT